jgi:hypothetical protein
MEWAMARTGGGGRGEGLGLWAGDSARTTFSLHMLDLRSAHEGGEVEKSRENLAPW